LGADVVKVEHPSRGDDLRAWGPPYTDSGDSVYFLSVNRNKQSLAVDIKDARGGEIVRRLAAKADVVIENFRPGTLDELGLGFDELHELNPSLVYCSLSAYGETGPYADLPGYDIIVQAMGGLMSVTGERDGPPLRSGVAVVDVLAGLTIATGVLGALFGRA